MQMLREDSGTPEGQPQPTPQEWEQHMAGIAARAALLDDEEEFTDCEEVVDTGRPEGRDELLRGILWASAAAVVILTGLVFAFVSIATTAGVTTGAVVGICTLLLAWFRLKGASARHGRSMPGGPAVVFGLLQRHPR
ncbi:hypothetical protein [Streptomyces marianii]|uniref:DUF3040 domain-containing protein n=1 Tax=Streptomyces marianii TaxID=1817406 RepID=A0A5R9EFN6_9ACTN|nr:hypothetical protein [Streptomyces marianii]TLQ47897.1 hypothetical protein FEF34_37785 [Streptomyces marianii]